MRDETDTLPPQGRITKKGVAFSYGNLRCEQMFFRAQNMKTLKMGLLLLSSSSSSSSALLPQKKKVFGFSFLQYPRHHYPQSSEVNPRLYLHYIKMQWNKADFCICPGLNLISLGGPVADVTVGSLRRYTGRETTRTIHKRLCQTISCPQG